MSELSDPNHTSGVAAFEAKNFSQAMRFLSPLAEKGDAEAQHRCAIMYQNGLGVAQNDAEAVKWMRAAAEQGHALAQHGMGFMYMEGECVEKDPSEAVKWFRLAAERAKGTRESGIAGIKKTHGLRWLSGQAGAWDSGS